MGYNMYRNRVGQKQHKGEKGEKWKYTIVRFHTACEMMEQYLKVDCDS